MALPSSGPISSSQVATEFSVSTTNISLSNLGTQLSTPISAGNEVELATDFYGQSGVTLTSFSYNSEGQTSGANACAEETTEDTAYHNGTGTYPDVDDVVYSDSGGTTTLVDATYKYDNGTGNGGFMAINEDGEVVNLGNCGRSDRRLKRNIVFRTYSKSGIPIYEFEYINKPHGEGRYVGTMAQDLIKLGREDAVLMSEDKSHYLVDYSKIDVDFYKI